MLEAVPYGSGVLFRGGPDSRVGVVFDDVRRSSGGIRGWVELHVLSEAGAPNGTPVHFASYDLTGSRTVASLAAGWKAGTNGSHRLEESWLSACVYDVICRVKAGPGDPVELARVAGTDLEVRRRWLIEPLWGRVGATRLIAEGGSGKSFLALALALQVATGSNRVLGGSVPAVTGPVLYLDWEADAPTHSQRLSALADGAGIGDKEFTGRILYMDMRAHGALYRTASAVRAQIVRTDAVAVILDSVMLARGSSGEGPAEESAVRLFEAIDQLSVPALLIDHKSKEQARSRSRRGGYGSVVMDNQSRNVWDVTQSLLLANGRRLQLSHTKANNTRLYDQINYDLLFDGDLVTFKQAASIEWNRPIEGTTEHHIVRTIVQYGPLSGAEIRSHHPDLSAEAIKKAIARSQLIVVLGRGKGNQALYGLADDAPKHLFDEAEPPDEDLPEPF